MAGGQERDGIVSGRGVGVRICKPFFEADQGCFTSTVAVCSRRVG